MFCCAYASRITYKYILNERFSVSNFMCWRKSDTRQRKLRSTHFKCVVSFASRVEKVCALFDGFRFDFIKSCQLALFFEHNAVFDLFTGCIKAFRWNLECHSVRYLAIFLFFRIKDKQPKIRSTQTIETYLDWIWNQKKIYHYIKC